ncbi:hypothetical protein BSU04_42670 [Caballeronia sordidicola]|uniref:Uncharacterized protein n=2 Tax=Caballeronia sordidicola TaxID=196367 RepID=A0A226WMD2_CABSO|nr:hypothetical protein BSU04_42670 [Caballeronia sordidicola]
MQHDASENQPAGVGMNTTNTYTIEALQHTQGVRAAWRELALSTALVCLGLAYALSWAEMGLALMTGPGEPAAALFASRALIGGLYVCVALRLQWARWMTVVLGFASVVLVGPMLGAEWRALHVAALVTGAVLVFKLAASIFLLSPGASHGHR